jgi:glycosyltransferase 2 family protein
VAPVGVTHRVIGSASPAARRIARQAGRGILVLLVVWALFRAFGLRLSQLDLGALAAARPDALPLVVSTILLVAVYLAHALLWRRIFTDLGGTRPPFHVTLRIYFISNLGRYLPGKVWQLAGMAVLAERAGLSGLAASAAAMLGQLVLLVTGALFVVLLLPGWAGSGTAVVAAAGLAAAAALVLRLLAGPLREPLRNRLRGRLGNRLAPALDFAGAVRGRAALGWAAGYALSWAALGLAFTLFVAAFTPDAALHARHLAGTVAASYLGGYLAFFAPGGIGVREAAMGVLLAQVVPAEVAVVIAIASRLWFTLAEVALLAVLPLLTGPRAGSETHNGVDP